MATKKKRKKSLIAYAGIGWYLKRGYDWQNHTVQQSWFRCHKDGLTPVKVRITIEEV